MPGFREDHSEDPWVQQHFSLCVGNLQKNWGKKTETRLPISAMP